MPWARPGTHLGEPVRAVLPGEDAGDRRAALFGVVMQEADALLRDAVDVGVS